MFSTRWQLCVWIAVDFVNEETDELHKKDKSTVISGSGEATTAVYTDVVEII